MNIVNKNSSLKVNNIIAQREFLISPKDRRCLCLWMCSCFCFDNFLTAEAKDFCHIMSPKNEIYAGFVDDKNYNEVENEMENWMINKNWSIILPVLIILLVVIVLVLGEFVKF